LDRGDKHRLGRYNFKLRDPRNPSGLNEAGCKPPFPSEDGIPTIPMNFSTFILGRLDPILVDWESFARTQLHVARVLGSNELRDSAAALLVAIADDMESRQSA
jgi:hypothetical protein